MRLVPQPHEAATAPRHLAPNWRVWYNLRHLNGEEAQMPITLTAPPAVVEGARSYAERSGMTLEAFVLAYLESAAKRE